jgi:hypothetical protein
LKAIRIAEMELQQAMYDTSLAGWRYARRAIPAIG